VPVQTSAESASIRTIGDLIGSSGRVGQIGPPVISLYEVLVFGDCYLDNHIITLAACRGGRR